MAKAGELEHASELYRGELLEGFHFTDAEFVDWLLVERARVHDLAVDVLQRLLVSQSGEPAVRTAQRLLQIDPTREETHRALMQLYAEAGNRSQALRQYQACRDRLKHDLDVAPSTETDALYRRLVNSSGFRSLDGGEASRSPRILHELAAVTATTTAVIAVLPFTNMSGDPEQEYFSDGITEDIITELSRFGSLHVIARNSSFAFKGKAIKLQEIAKELGVAYVVEGSVRKAGSRIRITAQLVEASAGKHVWAERYDRPAEDVFAIQDEVVRTVAATLAGRLEAAGVEGLRRRPTASLSAYECVLRGNALPVGDLVHEAAAHQLFEQAVALDPDYARACAQLAISHTNRWMHGMSESSKDLDRAFELANRAIVLDAENSVCHSALFWVQFYRRRYDEAEFHARKALALNPNRPNALASMADLFVCTGRPDEAMTLIADAMRLDPHHPTWYWIELGVAHFVARRYAEAVAAFRHHPNMHYLVQAYLAACHAQIGEDEAMRGAAAEVLRLRRDFSVAAFVTFQSYKLAADREHLASSLRKAGLPE
jgi:TolB-like protein/Tfp pilus assembly protein PilF